ncbi:Hypothetical protein R9X50_00207900 [Acrodontium crateriforme]|uniref:triacylglycerol lipase n=1 Tax=Acrodontium crateriforme TaxID=150365 RepID=A0AAQ3M0U9_9PEZI|nr:Hypothetical protein R9X50_00207900 [Acrodontium crateriforme]
MKCPFFHSQTRLLSSLQPDMFPPRRLSFASLLVLAGFGIPALATAPSEHDPYLILPPSSPPNFEHGTPSKDLGDRVFTLRHIYHRGTHEFPDLHRYLDIPPDAVLQVTTDGGLTVEDAPKELRVKARSTTIQRLEKRNAEDIDRILDYADTHGETISLPSSAWTMDEIAGPNITDKETIISFAKMASNAYVQDHNSSDWMPVGGGFNYTDDFGWQHDGLRGHIFADERNETVVIGLKGTSMAIFDGIDTTGNDKLNDNLFGSCCCGQQGSYTWRQVCDCATSTYTCNSTCVRQALREKGRYYWAVRDLYHNVTDRYPDSDVWLSGHSLGGVVSSLLGLTYGIPTITYEAFPDALAASRLGLPTPPGYSIGSHQSRRNLGIYHIGHTADPVYMGTCGTSTSLCSVAGYAFQTGCHTGQTCTYDTVGDLGWRVTVGTHRIVSVIRDVLKKYDAVPGCEEDLDCTDCFNWKYYESNGTEPITTTTSSATTSTRTRTETCKTPGWWGCLDESSTATTSTTTITKSIPSSSTSTCKTPGWFGCKDPTTTSLSTSPITTTKPSYTTSTSSSTTCETPGWFGCNDKTSTAAQSAKPSSTVAYVTATSTSTQSSSTSLPNTKRRQCVVRHWYGTCKEWRFVDWDTKIDL